MALSIVNSVPEHMFPLGHVTLQNLDTKKPPFLLYYGGYCHINVSKNIIETVDKAEVKDSEELTKIVNNMGFNDVIFNTDAKVVIYDLETCKMVDKRNFQYSPQKASSTSAILCTDGDNTLYKIYAYANVQLILYARNMEDRFETYKMSKTGKELFLLLIAAIYNIEIPNIGYALDYFKPVAKTVYQIPDKNLITLNKCVDKINLKFQKVEKKVKKIVKEEDLIIEGNIVFSDFLTLKNIPCISSMVHIIDDIDKFPPGTTDIYFASNRFWIKYETAAPPMSLIEYKDLLRLDKTTPLALIKDVEDFNYERGY